MSISPKALRITLAVVFIAAVMARYEIALHQLDKKYARSLRKINADEVRTRSLIVETKDGKMVGSLDSTGDAAYLTLYGYNEEIKAKIEASGQGRMTLDSHNDDGEIEKGVMLDAESGLTKTGLGRNQ